MKGMNQKKQQVFAILRNDQYLGLDPIDEQIAVVKIVLDLETARAEVDRLNALKTPDRIRYFWRTTRLYLGPQEPDEVL